MKIQVLLQPCPWCKKTPDLKIPTWESTWCWSIKCRGYECKMRPESPYIAIRKTSKGDPERLAMKLGELADKWNTGNDYPAYEYKVVDVSELIRKYGG